MRSMRHFLDCLFQWTLGLVAALALFCMMTLTLLDILSRKLTSQSIHGATELTEILMVAVIFAALPLVSWRREHVMLEILSNHLGLRGLAVQQSLINLISACAYCVLAWLMYLRSMRFQEYGETTSQFQVPLSPIAQVMAVCLLLTGLVHLTMTFMRTPADTAESAGNL